MKILRSIEELKGFRQSQGVKSIGFVPTMGALHAGHGSLVQIAREECDVVIASLFVNPTQFNNPDDLKTYPRAEENDFLQLKAWGADAVFVPSAQEIYHDHYQFEVSEKEISKQLCGAFRPGHFSGVLTVVLKLFNLVQPKIAFFGEKDFQQLQLIKGMVEAFFLPIQIVACPTVREADGLAMSSRNVRLTPVERELAARFPGILKKAKSNVEARLELESLDFQVDYVETWHGRRLAAATLGKVRLIDNVEV